MKKVISLFSGAGGLDLGFYAAGFKIAVCVEEDSSCCETLRRNASRFSPQPTILEGDIRSISSDQILSAAGLNTLEASLVIGGPPCQSFSLAGHRRGLDDPRGQLVKEFIRVVRDTLPVAFIMENVKGMLNWNGGAAIRHIEECFSEPINYCNNMYKYTVTHQVLNSANFGVPQFRDRVFIVGNRKGIEFEFPTPTHDEDKGLKAYTTVGEAICSLPEAEEPSSVAKRVSETIRGRRTKHGY